MDALGLREMDVSLKGSTRVLYAGGSGERRGAASNHWVHADGMVGDIHVTSITRVKAQLGAIGMNIQ